MIEANIVSKLKDKFKPSALFVENESHLHHGPRTESHFKVYMASDLFEGMSRVERQRLVNESLVRDFDNGLHALSLRLRTEKEHEEKGVGDFVSPTCASRL